MLHGKSILAVVPARDGSKGIPNKNLRKLMGTSLIGLAGLCLSELTWLDGKIISTDSKEFEEAEKSVKDNIAHLINNNGKYSVDHFHKKLGKIMWNKCGMARNEQGLKEAITEIAELRKEFWANVKVPGSNDEFNEELAKALRVADFLELGELFAKDALLREESAGGHFREEYQTAEGEAMRRKEFQYVSAWEYKGEPKDAVLHKEDLVYENIEVKERSYK